MSKLEDKLIDRLKKWIFPISLLTSIANDYAQKGILAAKLTYTILLFFLLCVGIYALVKTVQFGYTKLFHRNKNWLIK
ncbi:hypothetical protein [Marinilactibacillus piezotolerans]|uniref:hypothetical protein n=1 Tax=Marinilactibacillus piezotolerans TaxID=258723 RepID=UPI0009AFB7C5|nr:hypothetical protein [Marinilactibacillus piezotolerans]